MLSDSSGGARTMTQNTLIDVFVLIRSACREAGGQAAWAAANGMSAAYVSDVLNSRREPGPKVLAALGLRKIVRYVPARASA